MASRKQKIKAKRAQEEKEIRQVRMAVAIVAAVIVIALGVYLIIQSGIFDGPFEAVSAYSGTPDEICEQATPAEGGGSNGQYTEAPDTVLEEGVDYRAVLCTSEGAIYVDLFEDQTPVTVNNFVFLSADDFYNNTIFHRVLEGFMAQGGDPTGTGTGGPGYRFQDEIVPELSFDRSYLLAMANAGPGTNGSQFFITFAPTPWLDGLHTIFGEVLSGQDVVDALNLVDPQRPDPSVLPSDLFTVQIVTPDQVSE